MAQIARLGLFITTYFTIFFISSAVENNIENTFQGFTFLIVTIFLSGWIFSCHRDKKSDQRELKEMLYVITFLTTFTSLGSFLGIC